MVKYIFILLLYLGVSSCAFNDYAINYTNALKTKAIITIAQEGDFKELKEKITGYIEARGYKNIIYTDQRKEFFVFDKKSDFEEPCQIILKYTIKRGSNKIRIDLVKESNDLITDSQVSYDIHEIADQIKNN
jgi:hypothetical protein